MATSVPSRPIATPTSASVYKQVESCFRSLAGLYIAAPSPRANKYGTIPTKKARPQPLAPASYFTPGDAFGSPGPKRATGTTTYSEADSDAENWGAPRIRREWAAPCDWSRRSSLGLRPELSPRHVKNWRIPDTATVLGCVGA